MKRCLIAALLVLIAATVFAQHRWERRTLGVHWENGVPQLTFSVRDLASRAVRQHLEDGRTTRMTVTIQAYRTGSTRPITSRSVSCQITQDLFVRSYLVRRGTRSWVENDLAAVIERCLVLRNVTVGPAERYRRHRGRPIFFAVRAEFNPISRQRCRQLLRASAQDTDVGGSVVISLVRREICAADRYKQFRSQEVVVPGASR